MDSYLLKQLHSVSGGEGRRGRGAGTPVVVAGGRDAVDRASGVVVALKCVAKTRRPVSVSCLNRLRQSGEGQCGWPRRDHLETRPGESANNPN